MRLKGLLLLFVVGAVAVAVWLGTRHTEPVVQPVSSPTPATVTVQSPAALPQKTDGIPPRPKNEELAKLVDKSLSPRDRFNGDMEARFKKTFELKSEDIPALVYCLKDATDMDTMRNEVAIILRRVKYAGLYAALVEVLENPAEWTSLRRGAADRQPWVTILGYPAYTTDLWPASILNGP